MTYGQRLKAFTVHINICLMNKFKYRRDTIRWRDIEILKHQQWPSGALAALQMKFITSPDRLIKSEIALWRRTDALHAGAESDTHIRSVQLAPNDQICMFLWHWTYCTPLQARGRQLQYKMPTVVMLPDRIPSGMAGVSELSRICPPASCEALASTLPGSRQNSCLAPAVNYATLVFTVKTRCM